MRRFQPRHKRQGFFLFATPQVETWLLTRGMRLLKRHVKRAICKGTATWKLVKYQIDPLEYAARLAAGKGKE